MTVALLLLLLLAPVAPNLPVPYAALELQSANIPTAGTCFNVAYGLTPLTGGERPTFERYGILFQARKTCSVEDVTPAEPWHEAAEAELPEHLTYLDFPEYLLLFWDARTGQDRKVFWAVAWKEAGITGYQIYSDVVTTRYAVSHSPTVWLAADGIRLEMRVGGDIPPHQFKMLTPTSWYEVPVIGDPTLLFLPLIGR